MSAGHPSPIAWIGRATTAALAAAFSLSVAACTQPEAVGFTSSGDTRLVASDFPEAVLLDITDSDGNGFGCSGAVIAPRVVLTAGHCVVGLSHWTVTAPNAGNVEVDTDSAEVFDYVEVEAGKVNPARHDVGLVYLPLPIALDAYPLVSQTEARDEQSVVTLGRREQIGGEVSDDELFVTATFPIIDATASGFPYDYTSEREIDHGDSGGPVIAADSVPHLVLAVNSGSKPDDSQYARTDDVYAWIHEAIEAHGGSGSGSALASSASDASATP